MSDIEVDVPEPSPEFKVRQVLAEIQPWLLERNAEEMEVARASLKIVEARQYGRSLKRKAVNRLAGERYVITQMANPGLDPFLALDVLYGLSIQYTGQPGYLAHWVDTWAAHVHRHYDEIRKGS